MFTFAVIWTVGLHFIDEIDMLFVGWILDLVFKKVHLT